MEMANRSNFIKFIDIAELSVVVVVVVIIISFRAKYKVKWDDTNTLVYQLGLYLQCTVVWYDRIQPARKKKYCISMHIFLNAQSSITIELACVSKLWFLRLCYCIESTSYYSDPTNFSASSEWCVKTLWSPFFFDYHWRPCKMMIVMTYCTASDSDTNVVAKINNPPS